MPKVKTAILIERRRRGLPYIQINNHIISIFIIILFSAILSIVGLMLGHVMSMDTIRHFMSHPLLFVLNTLPLTLLMLAIYFASSRIWSSFVFGGGFFIIIELINRFKLELRDDPLIPSDLLLGGEVASVIEFSELPISKYLAAMIVLFVLAALFLVFFVKNSKLKIISRISGVLVCVISLALAVSFLYKDTGKYKSRQEGFNIYSTADMYRSRGFVYSFLFDIEAFKMIKPEDYSKKEAQMLLEKYQAENTNVNLNKPNVIAIMGEAFYDFDRIPGVEFIEGTDPLKNYREICEEAYFGSIVTSVFGGGTGSTEFSFLTGHSTALLPNGITPYKTHIRSDKYSLARYFIENGYSTTAFHPGHAWFYNRQNVYSFFGFENIFFRADMTLSNEDYRYGYVRDQTVMEFILSDYDRHLKSEPEKPYFNFTVTIENHGPYTHKKYDDKILVRPEGITDDVYDMINSYLVGLRESDIALGYLVSELNKLNEPFVLIYFGDHLPFLNSDYEGYRALNFNIGQGKGVEAFFNNYETPYFIWSNDAARKLIEGNRENVPVGNGPTISTCFLPVELQKYIGFTPNPYFEFLTQLEKSLPIITHYYYKQDGDIVTELSSENHELLTEYRKLQYYMMFDAN